jgi:hypothetical protein
VLGVGGDECLGGHIADTDSSGFFSHGSLQNSFANTIGGEGKARCKAGKGERRAICVLTVELQLPLT